MRTVSELGSRLAGALLLAAMGCLMIQSSAFGKQSSTTTFQDSKMGWSKWALAYDPVRIKWEADFNSTINSLQSLTKPTHKKITLTESDLKELTVDQSHLRRLVDSPSSTTNRELASTVSDQQKMILKCRIAVLSIGNGGNTDVNLCVTDEQTTSKAITKLGLDIATENKNL